VQWTKQISSSHVSIKYLGSMFC
ncbi:hypothetical protein CCACVL1_01278, partial [Corchorus capsularis]